MAIQELYNKLRIKREYGLGDVVMRLSFDEVDTLLLGLQELGADVNKGYENLLAFKEGQKAIAETNIEEKDTLQAYDGLRARSLTGKYKDAVGFIHIVKIGKKPIKLVFPSGQEQVYHPEQIEIIEKDREKFDKRMQEILSS
ncbi:hypothetical protein CVD28_03570 [Bacillus sp. M6-12]|uniref:hypothetical protein n=1 Tax=Bacillus sp. M6-12 TaxID=2054166 RepID=UPI000C78827F|nr:hypothetical protein [Bacillus sp. M6-12]PLS19507.1 hypothetical protein CVD28_03570 [Bacillus sp. M6-12]